MKYIYLIYLPILVGCQQKEQTNQKTPVVDNLKRNLIGEWGGFDQGRPVWKITSNSIYFYNDKRFYAYTIKGSDLFVEEISNIPMMKNISINKDTLFFYSRASVDKEVYMLTKAFRHK